MLCVMSLSFLTLTPARTRGVVGRADKENIPVDCFRRETAQSKERPKRKARHSATMRRRRGNASSSLVTQTISSVHNESDEHSIFFCLYFLIWSRFSALFSFVMPWWVDSLSLRLVCSQELPCAFCAIREFADSLQSGNG